MSWNFFDSWKAKRVNERPIECTVSEFKEQEQKCKRKHDLWQDCTDAYGFNDPRCREKRLGKYYSCVVRLSRMKNYIEDLDLHKEKNK